MSYRLRLLLVAALVLTGAAWTAGEAVGSQVICQGSACGGPGPSSYQYQITAPGGTSFSHWQLGVHDLNAANYINWVLPTGWVFGLAPLSLFQDDGFTPHGTVSTPTGMCPGYIDFSGSPITAGVFGFDHGGAPHDVGWRVDCLGVACPLPAFWVEDWTQPVGLGPGPVHAPLAAPQPPVCCFTWSPPNPSAGASVQFTDCSTDPDDLIIAWAWTFGDGGTSIQQNPTHVFAAGAYIVWLMVTDQAGNTAACAATITVSGPYCQVVCNGNVCGNPTGPTRFRYELTASPSYTFDQWSVGTFDPNLANYSNWMVPAGWSYTITSAGMFSAYTFYTPHTMFSFPTATCPYEIVFAGPPISTGVFGFDSPAALNDVGWQVQDTTAPWQHNANWLSPVGTGHGPVHAPGYSNFWPPVCQFTYSPPNPTDQAPVQFTDTSYDFNNTIVAWSWNFGDGGTSILQNPSHQFAAGTYTVTLTVTDNGIPPRSSTCSRMLTVRRSNINPSCYFTYTPPNPNSVTPVQFIDGSVDPDGMIVAWDWDFESDGVVDSTVQNPTWLYPPGRYNASLMVTDNGTPPLTATCVSAPIFVAGAGAQVFCQCPTVCPGGSPTWYDYLVVAPGGQTFDQFWVGTDDPNPANYTNPILPPGWWWWLLGPYQVPHDPCTDHGVVSPWTGYCPYTLFFAGPPIARGRFAFRHPSPAHDVGWLVVDSLTAGAWIENWAMPLGLGQGPVHAPGPLPTPNLPPSCNVDWDCSGCIAGQPIQFHANASDPDDDPMTYEWDFGDGNIGEPGSDPFHEFAPPAKYRVCVTVTDDQGASTECCKWIGIGPGEELCFPLALEGGCWHMITLPCYPIDHDPAAVFDELLPPYKDLDLLSGNLHRYDHDAQKYVTYYSFAPSEFGPIRPGVGYWLWLFDDEIICYEAQCSGEMEEVHFPSGGWYLMGSPQPTNTYIDCVSFKRPETLPTYPFSAVMNRWLQDPLIGYSCDLGAYDYTGLKGTDQYDHLRAFKGYWMYAFQPMFTMAVPPDPCCPPVCCFEYHPPDPCNQTPVQFIDCSYDLDGSVVGWEWDFGDGGTSTEQNPVHLFECGTYYVCLTVTDDEEGVCPPGAGNGTCCQTIIVGDATPPEITCPPYVTVCNDAGACDACGVDIGMATATDDCDPNPVVSSDKPECFPVGTTLVIWTACDESGNCSSCWQLITVIDCEPPTVECPADRVIESPDCAPIEIELIGLNLVGQEPITVTDNCPLPEHESKPDCTWEKQGSRIKWGDTWYNLWQHWGGGVIDMFDWLPDGEEPGGGAEPLTHLVLDPGPNVIEWGFCDQANNCSYCYQTITVDCPPVACFTYDPPDPDDQTVVQFTDCSYDPDGVIVAWEWDFENDGIVDSTEQNPTHLFGCGTYEVSLTVTNDSGHVDLGDFALLQIADGTPPVITPPGDITLCNDPGLCEACDPDIGMATATDTCDPAPLIMNDAPPCLPVGTMVVTWTACDEAGNCSSCEQTVTVNDCEPPSFECPPDTTLVSPECEEIGLDHDLVLPYLWGVSDNCAAPENSHDGDPDVDCDWDFVAKGHYNRPGQPKHCKNFNVWIHWKDGKQDGSADIDDGLTPTSGVPPTITGQPAGDPKPDCTWECVGWMWVRGLPGVVRFLWIHWQGGQMDQYQWLEVGEKPDPAAAERPAGIPLDLGVNWIEWTVRDEAGNWSEPCVQTVTVLCPPQCEVTFDPAHPECGELITFDSNAYDPSPGGYVVSEEWDFGDGTPMVEAFVCPRTADPAWCTGVCAVGGQWGECNWFGGRCLCFLASGEPLRVTHAYADAGTYTVCVTVTDDQGGETTCCQTVDVADTTPPVITCPGDITLCNDPGLCEACGPDIGMATATDNCDPSPVITNDAPPCFPVGTTLVTWTACDSYGNCSSCWQTITVNDCEPPTLECPPDTMLLSPECAEIGLDHDLVLPYLWGASDNCAAPQNSHDGDPDVDCDWDFVAKGHYNRPGQPKHCKNFNVWIHWKDGKQNGSADIDDGLTPTSGVPPTITGQPAGDPKPDCTWECVGWMWVRGLPGVVRFLWIHWQGGQMDQYQWLEVGEKPDPAAAERPAGIPLDLGVNWIEWTVRDEAGNWSEPCVQTVTVLCPPVADPNGPYMGHVGEPITLDGSGSYDPDVPLDSIVAWDWDINGDGLYGDRTGEIVPMTWPEIESEVFGGLCVLEDPRPISLRVTDSYGEIGEATTTLTVLNSPPIADPNGPYEILPGEGLTLDGSGSVDPDMGCGDSIVEWSWDINGDGIYGDRTGETVPMTWSEIESEICGGTCDTGIPYPITLRVTDSNGATGEGAATFSVLSPPECCFTYDPPLPDDQTPVQFTDCSTDPDGSIVGWEWDFDGDGLIDSIEQNPSHLFPAGTYDVCLTVTDNDGYSSTCCEPIDCGPSRVCQVICSGATCGGIGASQYQYVIAASPGLTLDYVEVGTHDPDLGNYMIWELPPGWSLDILPIEHLDNGFDPHGAIAMPTGTCPFSMVFVGPPIESGMIGFDHPMPPHDVGWLIEPLGCVEDWALPVGLGHGPVHAPGGPG